MQPLSHHNQVGHHIAVTKRSMQGMNNGSDTAACVHNLIESPLGLWSPSPCISESLYLSACGIYVWSSEEHIVICLAVKRRI